MSLKLQAAEGSLVGVGDVQEAVGILLFLVDLRHKCVSLQQILAVHEEVQRVLLWQLYALADDIVKVIRGQVVGDKVPTDRQKLRY